MSKRTFSDWAKAQKARDEANKLMTEEQFHMEVARRKHFNSVGRSAVREAVSLEIMASLRDFQIRSHKEQTTLLVITPLSGEGQTLVTIDEHTDQEAACLALSNYFKAVFAEEQLLKTEPIPGFKMSAVPKAKYRLDMYHAGVDLNLASTDFATLSRKTLANLPALVRLAQRMAKTLRKPEGVEILNPKFNERVKAYAKQAIAAAANDPIVVPAYESIEVEAELVPQETAQTVTESQS